jgi:hypothetical protein
MGVHIATRNRKTPSRYAGAGALDGAGVGAAHLEYFELIADLFCFSGMDHPVLEPG